MKKVLLMISIIFFLSQSYVQSCEKEGLNKLTDLNIFGYEMRTCKKGKWNGATQVFSQDGKLVIEGNYKDDHMDGIFKEYYEDGKLAAETNYINDKPSGFFKRYDKDGNRILEGKYTNGKLDKWSEYYKNGVIKSEMIFKDGKSFAKKIFDEQGKLIAELNQQKILEEARKRGKDIKN